MKSQKLRAAILINGILLVILVIWTIPTVGLLVSSVRDRNDIQTSGWWSVIPHRGYEASGERIPVPEGQTRDAPITIDGVSATYDEWREGVNMPDGTRLVWVGNLRTGQLEKYTLQWQSGWNFTLDNYNQ
ncbi:MAG: carbohydrate ABC transporter permease, partial [Anaerolineae bacterium]|nr:carbohydrate ABC transporter permease [Anaerolineae bacterium]